MKKLICLVLAMLTALSLAGCAKKILHCDGCGKELKCDDNMEEEWIIYCVDCQKELGLDNLVE